MARQIKQMGVLAVVMGELLLGCSESKVAQCNKLSAIVNQAAREAQATDQNPRGDRLAELKKNANSLDRYAEELAAVSLQDATLKGFQSRFIKMYQQTSKASLDLVNAFESKNIAAGSQAIKQWQQSSTQENALVDEVNQYCSGR